MKVISARNVEDALIIGMNSIDAEGSRRDSRNGPVLTFDTPVTTVYEKPDERVLFLEERDAHPFFHFMESLWMLAGRNDVEWITRYLSNIANFSDDGVTFHGAYGYRWRQHFEAQGPDDGYSYVVDQLETVIKLLSINRDDRRVVLQMWDPRADLGREGKDFPCNVTATFRVNPSGRLDMTVFNRSNDMIWGAYGANAVHFSMLQEAVARSIGVPMGRYWQVSTNFHAYLDTFEKHEEILNLSPGFSPYHLGEVDPFPIMTIPPDRWWPELQMFMSEGPNVFGYQDPFFRKVAVPMALSWDRWKSREGNFKEDALELAKNIAATDWRRACVEWLERRM